MFEKLGNTYYLIPIMWKDYEAVWRSVLHFALKKKLSLFKLRFIYPTEYKKQNDELWQFKVEEGIEMPDKRPPGPDYLTGTLNEKSIEILIKKKWRHIGFYSLEIFGQTTKKVIESNDTTDFRFEKFNKAEIKQLEKILSPLQRK
jgi:hypothetical protein